MFFKYSETVTMWNINAQIWKSSFHECTYTSLKRELYENSSDSDDCQKACWLIMNIKFRKKSRSSTRKYKHKKIFYHKLPLFLDAACLHQRRGDFFWLLLNGEALIIKSLRAIELCKKILLFFSKLFIIYATAAALFHKLCFAVPYRFKIYVFLIS